VKFVCEISGGNSLGRNSKNGGALLTANYTDNSAGKGIIWIMHFIIMVAKCS
jgi:hypothetical protein